MPYSLRQVRGVFYVPQDYEAQRRRKSNGEVSLPGYSIFRSDRTNGRGGGIAIYVKETLSIIRRADLAKDFVG